MYLKLSALLDLPYHSVHPAHPGEDLPTAVLREVREETGVETEFLSLLCFKHMRGYRYGCSDLYFICLLKPVEGATVPQANQAEIHECKWMDVSELASSFFLHWDDRCRLEYVH